MCSKRIYPTRDSAATALARIQHRIATGTIEDFCRATRGYYCDECHAWHLTKTDLRRKAVNSDVLPGQY